MSVDGDGSFLRFQTAVQQGEQRGLARSRSAHDGQELTVRQGEAQVVHAVIAIGEAEVDVPSAELHGLCLFVGVAIGTDDGGIIDGATIVLLQHATLLPHLIGTRQDWHIVEQHRVFSQIGEYQQSRDRVKQGLERSVEALDMMQLDMLRLAVAHEVGKVAVLFLGNTELLCHRLEHVMGTFAVAAAELHETQQQEGFLRGADLSVER